MELRTILQYGLFPVILILYSFISYFTGKEIHKEVDNILKKNNSSYASKMLIRILLTSIVLIILFLILKSKAIIDYHETLIMSIMLIALLNYSESSITDPLTHKINRHSLRFSYLVNLILIYLLVKDYSHDLKFTMFSIGILLFVLLVLFFIVTGIGSSDFRCFFISFPTLIAFYGNIIGGILIFVTLIFVSIYQVIKQKKNPEMLAVPIGPQILLPLPLLILVSTYLNIFTTI